MGFPRGVTVNVSHLYVFTETCFFRRHVINYTPGSRVLPTAARVVFFDSVDVKVYVRLLVIIAGCDVMALGCSGDS